MTISHYYADNPCPSRHHETSDINVIDDNQDDVVVFGVNNLPKAIIWSKETTKALLDAVKDYKETHTNECTNNLQRV